MSYSVLLKIELGAGVCESPILTDELPIVTPPQEILPPVIAAGFPLIITVEDPDEMDLP